jgi:hypothetical protein
MMEPEENPQETPVKLAWIAPQLVVLSIGATAGGPVPNTEAYNYRPGS